MGSGSSLLMVMALWFSVVLIFPCFSEAKVKRAVVVVRIPKVGPFVKPDDEEEWTSPLRTRLSEEETSQALRIGRRLRELYVRSSRLIRPQFNVEDVRVLTVDSVRALQTAQALGLGLYEQSSERMVDILPVRIASGDDEGLVKPCEHDHTEDLMPQQRPETLRAFWSDFSRFFHVHEEDETVSVSDWLLESALLTLQGSSPASRDEGLLSRVQSLGRNSGQIKLKNARRTILAHRLLMADVVQTGSSPLHVYVIEDDSVMASLVRAFTFAPHDAAPFFPLPRTLSVELHDEEEIDPTSGVFFIRVLQDSTPVTCSAQGEFYCEYEAFVQSAAQWMFTDKQWRSVCLSSSKRTPSPSGRAMSSNLQNEDTREEVILFDRRLKHADLASNHLKPSDSILPRSLPDQPLPCSSAPAQGSEEDFIHGFIVGCVLIGSLIACRCRGTRKSPVTWKENPSIADVSEVLNDEEYYREVQNHSSHETEELERVGDEVRLLPTIPSTNKGGITHIPRPKPPTFSPASNPSSPLVVFNDGDKR